MLGRLSRICDCLWFLYVSENLVLSYDKLMQVKENLVNGTKNMKKGSINEIYVEFYCESNWGGRGSDSAEMVAFIDLISFQNVKKRKKGLNWPPRGRQTLKIRQPGYFWIPCRLAASSLGGPGP